MDKKKEKMPPERRYELACLILGGVVLLPQVEEKADAGGMEAAAQAGDFHGQAGV